MVSVANVGELKTFLKRNFKHSEYSLKLKLLAGFASLYREIGFEYFDLKPGRLQKIRIFHQRLIQEFGQNGLYFCSVILKTYALRIEHTSVDRFVSEISSKSKTWTSRRATVQGFQPYALRHIIEYDFSRKFREFNYFIWGQNDGLSDERTIELAQSNNLLKEIEYLSPDGTSDIVFLEHQNAEIHHGDMVAVEGRRFPIDTWNFFDGSIPTANLLRINGKEFAIGADLESNETIEFAVCFGSSTNWYHFIVEVFPRYLIFGVDNLTGKMIVLPSGSPRQVQELLEYISGKPVYSLAPRKSMKCQKVVSCTDRRIAGALDVGSRKNDLKLVRHFFESQGFISPAEPFRRILISRGSSYFRNIKNFRKLESLLVSEGFEIIDPANMSVKDQAKVFSESKVIIGQSGAGFTNFVFAPPSCQIVELSDTDLSDVFWKEFALEFVMGHKKFVLKRKKFGIYRKFAPAFKVDLQELRAYCEGQKFWR